MEAPETVKRHDQALLCSVEDAAERLAISRSVVFRLIKDGRLRSVKIHKRRLVPIAALDEFVTELLEAP